MEGAYRALPQGARGWEGVWQKWVWRVGGGEWTWEREGVQVEHRIRQIRGSVVKGDQTRL